MKKAPSILTAICIAAAFAMTFQSCGKYEEGPSMSLKSKKSRLAREWVGDVYIDGTLGITANIPGDDITEYTKDGNVSYTYNGVKYTDVATWELSSNKEDLLVTTTILGISSTTTQKILRLTSKELWFIDTDGTADEIHYKMK